MKQKFDSIIFDMDGVLINETKSYRLAIEMTVNLIFSKLSLSSITQKDIKVIKNYPRFNNDWDVSYVLVNLIEKGINKKDYFTQLRPVTPEARKTKKYQRIKDIFQSFYLGEKLFQEVYNRLPPLSFKRGLNLNDSLLIEKMLLNNLTEKYKLGIVTSRPRFEALFTAKNLNITPQFIKEAFIVAKEDAAYEKPNPDPLWEIKKRMNVANSVYIGDTINDIIAANKAGIPCIFIGKTSKAIYKQFNNINQIKETFL